MVAKSWKKLKKKKGKSIGTGKETAKTGLLDCSNVEEITKGLQRLFFRSFSLLCKSWPKSKVTQDLGSGSRAVAIVSEDLLHQI